MIKKTVLIGFFVISHLVFLGQKSESFIVGWPSEYHWKTVAQSQDSLFSTVMMIPGKERPQSASIIAVMRSMNNVHYDKIDEIEQFYRSSIDMGTKLFVLQKDSVSSRIWIMFKTETAASDKYPEPESDLYFVIQGEYALYEVHVAIKKESLNKDFVDKWSEIFKNGQLTLQ